MRFAYDGLKVHTLLEIFYLKNSVAYRCDRLEVDELPDW